MIIAISGHPRSGKSTVAEWLAEKLRYEYFYTGGLIEEAARALAIPKEHYYELLGKEPDKERAIDHRQAHIIHQGNNRIVEGRIAPFIHVNARRVKINILFTVEIREAARRLQKKSGYEHQSIDTLVAHLEKRLEEERKHYLHLYHIKDHLDPRHFDIVIDTTHLSISDARLMTLQKIQEKIKSRSQ